MLKSKSRNFFYQHERRHSGGFSYFSSKSQSSTWASWELNKVVEWIAAWRACVQICLCSIWMKFKYFTRWLSWFHFSFVFFRFTFRRMKTSKIALLSLVWTNKVARPHPHQKSMTSRWLFNVKSSRVCSGLFVHFFKVTYGMNGWDYSISTHSTLISWLRKHKKLILGFVIRTEKFSNSNNLFFMTFFPEP